MTSHTVYLKCQLLEVKAVSVAWSGFYFYAILDLLFTKPEYEQTCCNTSLKERITSVLLSSIHYFCCLISSQWKSTIYANTATHTFTDRSGEVEILCSLLLLIYFFIIVTLGMADFFYSALIKSFFFFFQNIQRMTESSLKSKHRGLNLLPFLYSQTLRYR